MNSSTEYDVVDFFSGCGGMSYGFHKVGAETGRFRIVGAFDNNIHANATYERNLKFQPTNLDLANVRLEEINEHLRLGGRDTRKPLIVIGCAPCQGFSSHRKKDPRIDGRNSFVGRFGQIAVNLDAELIIMENVPDLLAAKHWHHYEAFQTILKANGYKISAKILNFAEFGVPQERHRAVIVASRNFQPSLPTGPFVRGSFKTVRDAISYLPRLKSGDACPSDPMHVTSKHRKETVSVIKQVPKDGGSRPRGVGPACLDKVKGFYDVYGRLYWDRPAVTITARCRTPSCGRFIHPDQDRGLSVREAALLQGFPPDFEFVGPFDDKFKQIGNAVSPEFSSHLAAHTLGLLSRDEDAPHSEDHSYDMPKFRSYSGSIARLKSLPAKAGQPN